MHILSEFHFTTIFALHKCLASKTGKHLGSCSYQCLNIFARISLTLHRKKLKTSVILSSSRLFIAINLALVSTNLILFGTLTVASFNIIQLFSRNMTCPKWLWPWLNKVYCWCCCLATKLCLTLCDPIDCSPPCSSIHKIFQGKNTGVDCHFLLQRIFLNHGLNLSCIGRWVFYQKIYEQQMLDRVWRKGNPLTLLVRI